LGPVAGDREHADVLDEQHVVQSDRVFGRGYDERIEGPDRRADELELLVERQLQVLGHFEGVADGAVHRLLGDRARRVADQITDDDSAHTQGRAHAAVVGLLDPELHLVDPVEVVCDQRLLADLLVEHPPRCRSHVTAPRRRRVHCASANTA
jgi:hypothetical protein